MGWVKMGVLPVWLTGLVDYNMHNPLWWFYFQFVLFLKTLLSSVHFKHRLTYYRATFNTRVKCSHLTILNSIKKYLRYNIIHKRIPF